MPVVPSEWEENLYLMGVIVTWSRFTLPMSWEQNTRLSTLYVLGWVWCESKRLAKVLPDESVPASIVMGVSLGVWI